MKKLLLLAIVAALSCACGDASESLGPCPDGADCYYGGDTVPVGPFVEETHVVDCGDAASCREIVFRDVASAPSFEPLRGQPEGGIDKNYVIHRRLGLLGGDYVPVAQYIKITRQNDSNTWPQGSFSFLWDEVVQEAVQLSFETQTGFYYAWAPSSPSLSDYSTFNVHAVASIPNEPDDVYGKTSCTNVKAFIADGSSELKTVCRNYEIAIDTTSLTEKCAETAQNWQDAIYCWTVIQRVIRHELGHGHGVDGHQLVVGGHNPGQGGGNWNGANSPSIMYPYVLFRHVQQPVEPTFSNCDWDQQRVFTPDIGSLYWSHLTGNQYCN